MPDDLDLWERNAGWWQDGFTDGADAEYEEQILPLVERAPGRRARACSTSGRGEGQIARLAAARRRGARRRRRPDDGASSAARTQRGGGVDYARADADALPVRRRRRSTRSSCASSSSTSPITSPRSPRSRGCSSPGGRFAVLPEPPAAAGAEQRLDRSTTSSRSSTGGSGPTSSRTSAIEELAPGVICRSCTGRCAVRTT